MEELLELKSYLEQGRYAEALNLAGELEEMSKDDKIHKIESFMEILLLHLIKQHAENRTTHSWDVSVRNAVRKIQSVNKRRKAGGSYLTAAELEDMLAEVWDSALATASLEACEGRYDEDELGRQINRENIQQEALHLLKG